MRFKLDVLLLISTVLLVVLVLYLLYYIYSNEPLCIEDPIKYYQILKNTSCFCFNELKP